MNKLDRYIAGQILVPLIATLSVAALLLILERMLRLFDFVVTQGGPADVVFQMLANLLPHYLGLALPIGVFLGCLLAFRRLSLTSELDAMLAAGFGLVRLMRPAYVIAVVLMIVNIVLIGWVQPHSRYTYRGLVFDLRSGALGASIKVGEFVSLGDKITLRVDRSLEKGSRLEGVFLQREQSTRRPPEEGNNDTAAAGGTETDTNSAIRRIARKRVAISAARGAFLAGRDEQTIILRLFDGVILDLNATVEKPRVLTFDQQDLTIDLPRPDAFRARGGQEREMTLVELLANRDDPKRTLEDRQALNGAFHWRLAQVLSFLLLPLLAIPMGIANKRGGQGSGLVVGLSLLIVYNELMESMQRSVAGGESPYLTIWALFATFGVINAALFRSVAFQPGGNPLAFIDRGVEIILAPVGRFLARLSGLRPQTLDERLENETGQPATDTPHATSDGGTGS